MPRKIETVVAPADFDRDAGKRFVIEEMPALRAAKWGDRAFLLLQNSAERVPENVAGLGMVGIAILTINVFMRGSIDYAKLEPLLDELMTCVKVVRDPAQPEFSTEIVSDDDVEEVKTVMWLRSEVLRVHTGFSATAALSALWQAAARQAESP